MSKMSFAVALALVVLFAPGASLGSPSKPIDKLCASFHNFDQNGDGQIEIRSLRPVASAGEPVAPEDESGARSGEPVPDKNESGANQHESGGLVLLLVEQRLLEPLEDSPELLPRLKRWANDLSAEGFRAEVIAVELAKSKLHQDGRYVLALREFLRAANRDHSLRGVMLVGRFPDAYLVRTINWRKKENVTLHRRGPNRKDYKSVHYLKRVPEPVARRADIVLSDLDGYWEDTYVQPKTRLETLVAVFGEEIPPGGGVCQDLERGTRTFEDFFHISDGEVEVSQPAAAKPGDSKPGASKDDMERPSVTILDEPRDHECSGADGQRPNTIARPDILVSRLDAKGVALSPREDIVGKDGTKLRDENGRPEAVQFASSGDVPDWQDGIWQADPRLERRLLSDYFDRNHAFRTGKSSGVWRPSSIACGLRSGYRMMRQAADDWEATDRKAADVSNGPTLVDFIDWMKYPAVLRTLRAHSNSLGSQFRRTNTDQLDAALEGPAWSWTRHGDRLEPSLSAACRRGKLNWFLLRSLWENGQVAPEPCFYHHTGCNGISPYGAERLAYDNPRYGRRQGAESLLLFGNGLALVGRAKTFYDEPRGFARALRDGETFGAAWAKYFELESQAESLRYVGGDIGRKRAYFWSVLGDWSLKLTTAAPAATGG